MDMVQATGPGGLPNATNAMSGVTLVGDQYIQDGDYVAQIHGWTMPALAILFTPLLLLHLLSGVRLRCINYTVFIIVLITGLLTAFWDSVNYNRVKTTSVEII